MRRSLGVTALAMLAVTILYVPPALAKDGDVRVAGACSASSTSKPELSREDGGVEVEFKVDQNRNGVRLHVVLQRNGSRVASRTTVTREPSRYFEARFVTGAAASALSHVRRESASAARRARRSRPRVWCRGR